MPMTLDEFARHLESAANVYLPLKLKAIADQIGADAAARAQAKLGTQQGAAGPYNAWEPLRDSTIADKERHGWPIPSPLLRSGELRNSIGYSSAVSGIAFTVELYTSSPYGAAHELGFTNVRAGGVWVAPRPFLGPVFYENIARYNHALALAMASVIIPPSESAYAEGGGATALMGTQGSGRLTSASGLWRGGRAAAQKMGLWKSLRGKR